MIAEMDFMANLAKSSDQISKGEKIKMLDKLIKIKSTNEENEMKRKAEKGKTIAAKFIFQLRNSVWNKKEAATNVDANMMSTLQNVFMNIEETNNKNIWPFGEDQPKEEQQKVNNQPAIVEKKMKSTIELIPISELRENEGVEQSSKAFRRKSHFNHQLSTPKYQISTNRKSSTITQELSPALSSRNFNRKSIVVTPKSGLITPSRDHMSNIKNIEIAQRPREGSLTSSPEGSLQESPRSHSPTGHAANNNQQSQSSLQSTNRRTMVNNSPNIRQQVFASPTTMMKKPKLSLFSIIPQVLAANKKNVGIFASLASSQSNSPSRGIRPSHSTQNSPSLTKQTLEQRYRKLLKDKKIEETEKTKEIAEPLIERINKIEEIMSERLNSATMKTLKIKVHEQFVEETLNNLKKDQAMDNQKMFDETLNGERLRKQQLDIRAKRRSHLDKTSGVVRIRQARKKYFYEVEAWVTQKEDNDQVNVHKFSDYANDIVLAEILGFLLVKNPNKLDRLAFLNNSNMENISKALKRLINGAEHEMEDIMKEKARYSKAYGVEVESLPDNKKFFKGVLKKSRFKKALLNTERIPQFEDRYAKLYTTTSQPDYYKFKSKRNAAPKVNESIIKDEQNNEDSKVVKNGSDNSILSVSDDQELDRTYRGLGKIKSLAQKLIEGETLQNLDEDMLEKLREDLQKNVFQIVKRLEAYDAKN